MAKLQFTAYQLKLIAISAMTIDHVTWLAFPGLNPSLPVCILHIIGRLTAPIMWFFIAEGCTHTHDKKKYMGRLAICAVISHFAYCFAFGIPFFDVSAGVFNRTSVLWPLTLAVAVIAAVEHEQLHTIAKYGIIFTACIISFPADWSSIAVMAPVFLHQHRGDFKKQAFDIILWSALYAAVYCLFIDWLYGLLQLFTCLSIPFLFRYNGERGAGTGGKWLFYVYYPAHLVVIGLIRLLIRGSIPLIF